MRTAIPILALSLFFAACDAGPGTEPREAPSRRDPMVEMLQAENRDGVEFLNEFALDLQAPVNPEGFGKVRNVHGPCGSSVRPYIIAERPFLGETLRIAYHLAGLPLDDPSELGIGFIAVGIGPLPSEPHMRVPPNRCAIYPRIGDVLLWVVRPDEELDGPLIFHEPQSRIAWLVTAVPNVPAVHGQRAHTQLAVFDHDEEWRTSQAVEITFGNPYR